MACARCDFYTPKDSAKAQLIEARDNLQHMLAAIPLTDDERAAVDDGRTALGSLLERLADVPTPAGPTPRQIGIPQSATMLPVTGVRHGKADNASQILFHIIATVIDCATRKIVGWAMDDNYKTPLISSAIQMAARNLPLPEDAIFHSDRGSNYTSGEFAEALSELGIRQSVGRTGICYDNALSQCR